MTHYLYFINYRIYLLLACIICFVNGLNAQDKIVGSWKGTLKTDDHTQAQVIELDMKLRDNSIHQSKYNWATIDGMLLIEDDLISTKNVFKSSGVLYEDYSLSISQKKDAKNTDDSYYNLNLILENGVLKGHWFLVKYVDRERRILAQGTVVLKKRSSAEIVKP